MLIHTTLAIVHLCIARENPYIDCKSQFILVHGNYLSIPHRRLRSIVSSSSYGYAYAMETWGSLKVGSIVDMLVPSLFAIQIDLLPSEKKS